MSKAVFVFFLLLMGVGFFSAWAQSDPEDPSNELLKRIQAIETQAQRIEANQKEILARQEKILAEIDRIRIWTRRS